MQNKKTSAPPAIQSEREQRAAKLPTIKDKKLDINPSQAEFIFDLIKANHLGSFSAIIDKANMGKAPQPELADHLMNTSLQQIAELKPQSYLESMLISQMIQVNNATGHCMDSAFREGQGFKVRELYANLAIKFQRTFVAQVETLQKLRGKGGQRVVVEHVTVQAGGQAVVGNITHGGGAGGEK